MTRAKLEKTVTHIVALAALSGVGAAGCRHASAEAKVSHQEAAVKVQTTTVDEGDVPRFLTMTGTLIANQDADVAADAMGRIAQTYVERGSLVPKGAPLARIDARSLALTENEASAQVHALEVESSLATRDCARSDKLFEEGSISKAEHDRQSSRCQSTDWSKTAAEARARMAVKAVGDSVIRAPFAGIVAERFVTPGEYVHPDTRVVTLVDMDTMRLELTVSESAVNNVEEGQTVGFRVAGLDGVEFPAKVRYVGPALRRASRDLLVEATLANHDHKLRPGMFATARIALGTYRAPTVSLRAVHDEGSVRRVFVVRDKKVEERIVETGERLGEVVAVVQGLKAGEQVVETAAGEIKDGVRVE
jgi:membrane fusion protein (multidrug efflux system)